MTTNVETDKKCCVRDCGRDAEFEFVINRLDRQEYSDIGAMPKVYYYCFGHTYSNNNLLEYGNKTPHDYATSTSWYHSIDPEFNEKLRKSMEKPGP